MKPLALGVGAIVLLVSTGVHAQPPDGNAILRAAGVEVPRSGAEGAFDAGVNLLNFARGDNAAIHVGSGFAGGVGVIHAQGLPLVVFKAEGGLIDLPVDVLVMLAGSGQANLQISFVTPAFDHVTTLDVSVILPGQGSAGSLTFRSSIR